jgi:hypothetical protein
MLNLYFIPLAQGSSRGIPWWVWIILIIILLVLLWFWFGREEDKEEDQVEIGSKAEKVHLDDLKKIEGIGPKVASLLAEKGITTFEQLVDAGADKLEGILDEASLQMIDADTWPEQAKLAAAGDWEELEKLQDQLKGGKRE